MKKIIVFFLLVIILFYSCKKKNPTAPSAAGSQWTQSTSDAAFSPREQSASVVYNNQMWLIGGYNGAVTPESYNDVWYSSDGGNWGCTTTAAPFTARNGHTCIVFNNAMWVIAGAYTSSAGIACLNDVWQSTDGANWTCVTANAEFGPRYGQSSVIYSNMIWIIGGSTEGYPGGSNDVWHSTDGINWIYATINSAFSPRRFHTSLVYNNGNLPAMWVIGGVDVNGNTNDVWYSTDGADWACATTDAGFSPRYGHTSLVYNNEMWVIGGENLGGVLNGDVWYSSDGITWIEATSSAAFSARVGHASVLFNSRMWVMAGYDASDSYKNDTYWTQ